MKRYTLDLYVDDHGAPQVKYVPDPNGSVVWARDTEKEIAALKQDVYQQKCDAASYKASNAANISLRVETVAELQSEHEGALRARERAIEELESERDDLQTDIDLYNAEENTSSPKAEKALVAICAWIASL